jgi:hypothetical protein
VIAVRIELLRGLGLWMFLALVVAGIFAFHNAMPGGYPIWPYAVSALGQVGQVMGPLAAGTAALAGIRCKRRRTNSMELLAVRGPLAAGLTELAALLIWTTVAFAVVLAVVFIPVAVRATGAGPDGPRIVASLVGLLAQPVVGYALGRLLPFRLTPLIVAAAIYVSVNSINSSTHGIIWNLFLPENLNLYDEFNHLNAAVAPAEILWYVGLATLGLGLWFVFRRTSALTAVTFALGLALSVGGFFAIHSQHGFANARGVFVSFDCAGSDPQICVNPAMMNARPALQRQFAPIIDRLRGTPFAINRAEQRPRGLGSAPTPGASAFALDNTKASTIRDAAQELAENTIAPYTACQTDNGPMKPGVTEDGPALLSVIADRVLIGQRTVSTSAGSTPTLLAAAKFDPLTDDQVRAFLTTHQQAIRNCMLTLHDFG